MRFEWFVGVRYLKEKRRQRFISMVRLISIAGIAIGVMALAVALSMTSGFQSALRDKIIGTNAHVLVMRYGTDIEQPVAMMEKVGEIEGIAATTPFVYGEAMLTSGVGICGAVVRGVDLDSVGSVTDLRSALRQGDFEEIRSGGETAGIFLGAEVARTLKADVGDRVDVIAMTDEEEATGFATRMRPFVVKGIIEIGMYEYDASLTFIDIVEAQDFFTMGESVTGFEIRVEDPERSAEIADLVQEHLGFPFWARDWKEMNRNFFAALKLQKTVMFIVLALIILVGAFNIISTLIMTVMEKNRDVAVIRAMGATAGSIMRIFIIEGMSIGCIGTALGMAGGYAACRLLAAWDLIRLDPQVYYIGSLPVEIRIADFLVIAAAALGLSLVATLYPSRWASRLDPVEAIRYE